MFEKEAKERARDYTENKERQIAYECGFLDGAGRMKEEMQKQIKKMKCCENCKHSDTECEGYTICGIGHYDDCLSNKVLYHTTDEKDYWEKAEK